MRKGTIIAAVVFLALVAATFISLRRPEERGITRLSFPGFDKDAVTELVVTGPNPIDIKKTGGKWVLGDGKPADETAVKNALEAVGKIDSSDVVSSSAGRYAALEVDETKGNHVVIWAGSKKAAEFTLGKASGGKANVKSGETVYAVKGIYPGVFAKSASAWHQLKLFSDQLDDATKVEVALSGTPKYSLIKKDGKWELEDPKLVPEGFRFDHDVARGVVQSIVSLSAKEVLDKDPGVDTTKLDAKSESVAYTGKDGTRHEVHFGAALADKSIYARVTGRDDLYTLTEWAVKGMRKAPSEMREMTLMKLDTAKAKKLSVSNGKSQLVLDKEGADWKVVKSSDPTPPGFQFDPGQVTARLNAINNARALRVATAAEQAKSPLAKPTATITVTPDEGAPVTLVMGGETKDEHNTAIVFARGNVDHETYVLSKALYDRLAGGLTTFKKAAQQQAPSFDPSSMNNLPPDVRQKLMQQMAQQHAMNGMKPPEAHPK